MPDLGESSAALTERGPIMFIDGTAVLFRTSLFALCFASSAAYAQDRVLRDFAPGSSAIGVGIADASTDSGDVSPDSEIEGPQAIYSDAEGKIYMLDQVNNRVLRFDPNEPGSDPQVLQLPDDMQPTDLVVSNGKVYVWDNGQARALQPVGAATAPTRSLTLTRDIAAPDDATLSAFAQMGSVDLPAETDADGLTRSLGKTALQRSRQTIASHGRGQITADLAPLQDSGVDISLRLRDGGMLGKYRLKVRDRLGAVEVLDVDQQGRVFVLGENIPNDLSDTASAFVARFSGSGTLEGIHELPFDSSVALSRRFVTVSPTGDVYFLRTRKGAVDVLGVGFRPLKPGQVIGPTGGPLMSLKDFARPQGAKGAVRPLTRAQVIETAYAFANAHWRVNAGSYGSDPDRICTGFDRVRRPGYLHGKLNQDVVGIPYCWGCMGSLPQIAAAFDRGMLAGNVCTRNDPRRDVAGVDCSAFVSACWGLTTHFSTLAIPAIAQQLANPWDLLPGDALDKPGSHVMLFVRFTPDRKAEVIESSTGGCNGKVCRNVYPLASLLARGFRPVRYRGLANDMSKPADVATIGKTPQGKTKRR